MIINITILSKISTTSNLGLITIKTLNAGISSTSIVMNLNIGNISTSLTILLKSMTRLSLSSLEGNLLLNIKFSTKINKYIITINPRR